jgi:hypothetical protein
MPRTSQDQYGGDKNRRDDYHHDYKNQRNECEQTPPHIIGPPPLAFISPMIVKNQNESLPDWLVLVSFENNRR